jgi:tetratricopeptide (TPR) repeat protein
LSRICKISLIVLTVCLSGCLRYEEVMYRTKSRFLISDSDIHLARFPAENSIDQYSASDRTGNERHHLMIRVKYSRYYAVLPGCSAAAKINRKAVQLAVDGKFGEARMLFSQLIEEFPDEAAGYNNLGLVHEVSGHREKAFTLLSKACILDPENYYFRKNFLYMHEKKQ